MESRPVSVICFALKFETSQMLPAFANTMEPGTLGRADAPGLGAGVTVTTTFEGAAVTFGSTGLPPPLFPDLVGGTGSWPVKRLIVNNPTMTRPMMDSAGARNVGDPAGRSSRVAPDA